MIENAPFHQPADVTEVFEHYRLTARELWNRGFWELIDLRKLTGLQESFESINKTLFETLVLERLAIRHEAFRSGEGWLESVNAVPVVPKVVLAVLKARPQGSFDVESERVCSASGLRLGFQEYFEWGYLSYVDFRQILVKVLSCGEDPAMVARML